MSALRVINNFKIAYYQGYGVHINCQRSLHLLHLQHSCLARVCWNVVDLSFDSRRVFSNMHFYKHRKKKTVRKLPKAFEIIIFLLNFWKYIYHKKNIIKYSNKHCWQLTDAYLEALWCLFEIFKVLFTELMLLLHYVSL